MLSFINIASGSKGNATLVYNEDSLILLDMGVPKKLLLEGLKKIGKKYQEIQAVLITHSHNDHIACLNRLHDDFPIYAGMGVAKGECSAVVFPGIGFDVGSIYIVPIEASHDAVSPLGYVFCKGTERIVYLTDTGVVRESVLPYIANSEYYIIESNHDVGLLLHSNRPKSLKDRILGNKGHLSNEQSALAMAVAVGPRTKKIYLAHLSEECNSPELAIETYKKVFRRRDVDFDTIDDLVVLSQHEMTKGGDIR